MQKLIEASLLSYAQQLRNGDVQIKAADLPRLYKLLLELWQQPEELPTRAAVGTGPLERSPEHKLHVLRALHESGVLDLPDLTFDPNAKEDMR